MRGQAGSPPRRAELSGSSGCLGRGGGRGSAMMRSLGSEAIRFSGRKVKLAPSWVWPRGLAVWKMVELSVRAMKSGFFTSSLVSLALSLSSLALSTLALPSGSCAAGTHVLPNTLCSMTHGSQSLSFARGEMEGEMSKKREW